MAPQDVLHDHWTRNGPPANVLTRAQSVSHYNRPTLVSLLLTSLHHLHNSIPTLANGRSPPGSQSALQLVRLISGPTVPTDIILPSCPTTLLLLSSPDPFPMESHLSQVQCSVSLVVPKFQTISLFQPSSFPYLQLPPSFSVHLHTTPLFPFLCSLRSPLVPTCTLPILPPNTSCTSRVHCLAFHI